MMRPHPYWVAIQTKAMTELCPDVNLFWLTLIHRKCARTFVVISGTVTAELNIQRE
jgi:hypothetical protein